MSSHLAEKLKMTDRQEGLHEAPFAYGARHEEFVHRDSLSDTASRLEAMIRQKILGKAVLGRHGQ